MYISYAPDLAIPGATDAVRAFVGKVVKHGVRRLVLLSGRVIRYVQIPHEAFAAGIAEAGLPDDIVWLLNYLFATVLDGRNASLGHGVQRALGSRGS